jgi:hypothetical protein
LSADGFVGGYTSLALDALGNPSISYYDYTNDDLKLLDSAVHLVSPAGGERWAAGSQQVVRWIGAGSAALALSTDGGLSYQTIHSSVSSNEISLLVPTVSTEQARIRISRSTPYSTSQSRGYFLIAPNLGSPWWAQTVNPSGIQGEYTSIALDRNGNPAISYYDLASLDLKYASRSGPGWTFETAAGGPADVGQYSSLALNTDGEPRIAYYDATSADLKFASRTGGVWSNETVDSGGDVGQWCSLALDAQGNPHISYFDADTGDLGYATKSGGVWSLEAADATDSPGIWNSIDVDGHGNPHISYYESLNNDLKYAAKIGGAWVRETVDTGGGVGRFNSLALDPQGDPHISYFYDTRGNLKYAERTAGVWQIETVDSPGTVGLYTSLALDGWGEPRITYYDSSNDDLKYAARFGGTWAIEAVDAAGDVGPWSSLALDSHGNPRISYFDQTNFDLRYASAAIEVTQPSPGATWPVGASRTVTWEGSGRVDMFLSVDGGNSWQLQKTTLTGGEYRLTVPHTPSRFCKMRLDRAVPRSEAVTDSFFTIETDIVLLNLKAESLDDGAVHLAWETDPGPADLLGYKLEKTSGGKPWRTLVALTGKTSFIDPEGGAGSRYRLFAVNGLGEELLLGETSLLPAAALAAWPLPYRGGKLHITFATSGGRGGGAGEAVVALYDLAGRRVRTIANGRYEAGYQSVLWDGTDEMGRGVRPGIYFLKARSGGEDVSLKLVVLQ